MFVGGVCGFVKEKNNSGDGGVASPLDMSMHALWLGRGIGKENHTY